MFGFHRQGWIEAALPEEAGELDMCGICGVLNFDDAPASEIEIERMKRSMLHRGPDGEGTFLDGPLGLGMRRLSIIDLEGGKQPAFNEDGSVAVVFNGEIYNYVELGNELRMRGHCLASKSDTEVICHLYEEEGADCFARFNGMFAIAIWDRKNAELILGRDRMGVKPLYYCESGNRLKFASELKVLCEIGRGCQDLDEGALAEYLRIMYIRAPRTPFRSIKKLCPGHLMRVKAGRISISRWWELRRSCIAKPMSLMAAAEEVGALLEDSVRLRMRSDIPVGTLLSGGIDSSVVTGLAAKAVPTTLDTFAVGFKESEFDELQYAHQVAGAFGTNHHERVVAVEDVMSLLPTLIWHLDEPNGDSAIVPTYLISRFAAERLKVILSGLGGDELFGGYDRYFDGYPVEQHFRKLPYSIRKGVEVVAGHLAGRLIANRIALNNRTERERYEHRVSVFDPVLIGRLMGRSTGSHEIFRKEFSEYPADDSLNRLMYVDSLTYLPDDILHITDRMSMAVSLEARTPFLDYRLVQLAAGLPGELKMNRLTREWKISLKEFSSKLLPKSVINRPKWGFGSPLKKWMSSGLEAEVKGVFEESVLISKGILVRDAVWDYLSKGVPGERLRRAQRLWSLLVLELWARTFLGRAAIPPDVSADMNRGSEARAA